MRTGFVIPIAVVYPLDSHRFGAPRTPSETTGQKGKIELADQNPVIIYILEFQVRSSKQRKPREPKM